MIEALARRPRSVTGSARPDSGDVDADINSVYSRPMPQPAVGWAAHRLRAAAKRYRGARDRWILEPQLPSPADSRSWVRYNTVGHFQNLCGCARRRSTAITRAWISTTLMINSSADPAMPSRAAALTRDQGNH